MKIQDIKTPGFITEPRLMGEQDDNTGIGQFHISGEGLYDHGDGYYMSMSDSNLYFYNGDEWFKFDKNSETYTPCSAPFRK